MTKVNFSSHELKLLSTKKALKMMLKSGNKFSPEKTLKTLQYERELKTLQNKLIELQNWVIKKRQRVCILFEGRDAAGKGGAIRRITHYLNPRFYKVNALPKPSEKEMGQWYFQRYINKLPNPSEIVFFDRSWYNRAVVEPVNGFCTIQEYERFLEEVNGFEEMLINDGIILIKLYISISKEEQKSRFSEMQHNPLKRWKITPVDLKAQDLWDQYTDYKERMFKKTNTKKNPWIIIQANKKAKARTQIIKTILSKIPFKAD